MASKIAYVGLVILVIGLILGAYAAFTPVSATTTGSHPLLNTSLKVDPNDYESQNVFLSKSETVNIQTVSITNNTVFFFYIMNQSQYYNWYGCAPWCRGAPAGTNASANGAGNTSAVLPNFLNATVTPSSPVQNHAFTAPTNGTYYFIFDNTMGPSFTTYEYQNASGNTIGNFTLLANGPVTTHSVNSVFLYAGVALLIIGGAVATATWDMGRRRPRGPPPRPTTTTTAPEPAPAAPSTTST